MGIPEETSKGTEPTTTNTTTALPSELYAAYKKRPRQKEEDDDDDDHNVDVGEEDGIVDHDGLLQNLLCSLATLDAPTVPSTDATETTTETSTASSTTTIPTVAGWFWEQLTRDDCNDGNDGNDGDNNHHNHNHHHHDQVQLPDRTTFEWSMGLQYIHNILLPNISSPLELHSIARQSLLLFLSESSEMEEQDEEDEEEDNAAEDDHTMEVASLIPPRPFVILCLLLCAHALWQQRPTIPKRWKRWQSIIFETIYLVQHSILLRLTKQTGTNDDGDDNHHPGKRQPEILILTEVVDLWTKFIAPACLHVVHVLPTAEEEEDEKDGSGGAYHVALFAGLVGTTITIAEFVGMVVAVAPVVASTISPVAEDNNDDVILVGSTTPSSMLLLLRSLLGMIRSMDDDSRTTTEYVPTRRRRTMLDCSEWTVWKHPWRRHHHDGGYRTKTGKNEYNNNTNDDDDDDMVTFWIYQKDLNWWTNRTSNQCTEERVAQMDTRWKVNGIAILAMLAFQDRPLVYHPTYVWEIWFPHISILLLQTTVGGSSSPSSLSLSSSSWPLTYLQRLLDVTPQHCLSMDAHDHHGRRSNNSHHDRPDAPFQVFQWLSNQMMNINMMMNMMMVQHQQPSAVKSDDGNNAQTETPKPSKDEEDGIRSMENRKQSSEWFTNIMKQLLNRYTATSQIHIVERLIQDCPHPGLQARFLDLLRPLLPMMMLDYDNDGHLDALATLLTSILTKCILQYWETNSSVKRNEIVRVDELIQTIELAVGAITMIQLWGRLNLGQRGEQLWHSRFKDHIDTLAEFHRTLQNLLDGWSKATPAANATITNTTVQSTPPEEYHRLFLLDHALQTLLDG